MKTRVKGAAFIVKNGTRLLGALAVAISLTGCAGFFSPIDGSSSGGGTGTTTSSFIYVTKGGSNQLNAYNPANGGLVAVSGSPYSLGYTPTALAVTPANTFLYVASSSTGNVYGYTISSTGTLTAISSGSALASGTPVALDISADGNYLALLNSTVQSGSVTMYSINISTGILTPIGSSASSITLSSSSAAVKRIKFSPNGLYLAVALGTDGDIIFNMASGIVQSNSVILPAGPTVSDNAVAFDANSAYVYVARGGSGSGVAIYKMNGTTNPTYQSTAAAGGNTLDVGFSKDNNYLYAANQADGTISGYSVGTGGALTPITGSPFTAGSTVAAVTAENSGSYFVGFDQSGTPDLKLFAHDSTGAIYISASVITGQSIAGSNVGAGIALATTH